MYFSPCVYLCTKQGTQYDLLGYLQGRNAGPRFVALHPPILLGKHTVLHGHFPLHELPALSQHVLLHFRDVLTTKQDLDGPLQNLCTQKNKSLNITSIM